MLSVIAVLCAVAGLAEIGFAFLALRRQRETLGAIEKAAVELSTAAKQRFESGWPEERAGQEQAYADLPAAAELTRALGEVGVRICGLTPPVAALAIATLPLALAAGLAVLGELHG